MPPPKFSPFPTFICGAAQPLWPIAAASAFAVRKRRSAAGRQESAASGLGQQRSASRLRPFAESRQRRNHGHAGRRRDVEEARSRRRMEEVARLARRDLYERKASERRDHARIRVRKVFRIARPCFILNGTPCRSASLARKSLRYCSTASRASCWPAARARARTTWKAPFPSRLI